MTTLEMENISRADQTVRIAIAVAMSVSTLFAGMDTLTMALINMAALIPLISGITAIDPLRLALKTVKSKVTYARFHKEPHAI